MAPRTPSLNWLRVFEAAARTESFARAATQLHLSAAAVSQQIKALETRLGTPLFIRHAHSVKLTEAGRAYFPAVQHALLRLDSATTGLFGESREQQLFIQSVLLFAHGVLAPSLSSFDAAHPGVRPVLNTGNSEAEFVGRFSDLQVVFGEQRLPGNDHDKLLGETLYPVASPAIAARIAAPGDLLDIPLIEVTSHRAGWPYVLDALRLPASNASYRYVDNTLLACVLAASAAGVALARSPASDLAVRSAGLVPCLEGFSVPGQDAYHLLYPSRSSLRPAAREFRAWLLDHLADCRDS